MCSKRNFFKRDFFCNVLFFFFFNGDDSGSDSHGGFSEGESDGTIRLFHHEVQVKNRGARSNYLSLYGICENYPCFIFILNITFYSPPTSSLYDSPLSVQPLLSFVFECKNLVGITLSTIANDYVAPLSLR